VTSKCMNPNAIFTFLFKYLQGCRV